MAAEDPFNPDPIDGAAEPTEPAPSSMVASPTDKTLSPLGTLEMSVPNGHRPRPALRPRKGIVGHLLGVVGGGVLGLAIGYYLLNWLGGPRYNFLEISLPGLSADGTRTNTVSTAQPLARARPRPFTFSVAEAPAVHADDGQVARTESAAEPAGAAQEPVTLPAEIALPADYIGPREHPQFGPPDLAGALIEANAVTKIDASAYEIYCHLAEVVTYVELNPGDPANVRRTEAVHTLLLRIATPDNLAAIAGAATAALDETKRTESGIALVGRVAEVTHPGCLHAVRLVLPDAAREVTVLSWRGSTLVPGDRALILGSIIENPAATLVGYEGALPQVVWGGFALTLKELTEGNE